MNSFIRKFLKIPVFNPLRRAYYRSRAKLIIAKDLENLAKYQKKALNLKDEQIVDALLPSIKTIIDVGCEGSKITAYLSLLGYQVTGVDLDKRMIGYVQKLIKKNNYNFVIDFKVADIYKLPFKDRAFDAVICSEVLEHLDDPKRGIDELCRIARQQVIITTPVGYSFNSYEHIQHFKDGDINSLLRNYNFKYKKIITKTEDVELGQKLFLITIAKN